MAHDQFDILAGKTTFYTVNNYINLHIIFDINLKLY